MALTEEQLRAFVPRNYFLKSPYTAPVPVEEEEVTTSYGIPNTDAFTHSGDGGGGGGGYGLFGDLDKSTEKIFNKDVWDGTGWVNTPVKGYKTSTGWKTYEGKNINHAGIEFPTIAGLLLDKNFGKGPQPGDIKGTFTDGWDSGIENIKEGWEDEKEKWSEILGIKKAKAFFKAKKEKRLQDEIPADNTQAAVDAAAAKAADQGGGGAVFQDSVTTSGGDTYAAGDYSDVAGTLADPREKMDYYNQGGRVPFFYGGLASMLGREGLAPGGPAGGASAGGDYGGNVNPEQEYAGSTFEERHGGGDNQNNTVVVPKTNYIDVNPELLREDPYVDLSVMSPLEKLKLRATIGYRDIFDNDDLYAKGDLTTNLIPGVTTNTQVTDDGIGNTTLNLGNFSTTIDPNKNLKNFGYNNSYNGVNYGVNYGDGNTMFNVSTTFGGPDKRTHSLQEQNPDLILSNMKYGGLARLL